MTTTSLPDAVARGGDSAPADLKILQSLRVDLQQIAQWVAPESRLLDLGCGEGDLLAHVQQTKRVRAVGVELDDARVCRCVARGVPVIQQNLEQGLALFDDDAFDTVVLSQTLQAMHNTEKILVEMRRVGRAGIVSFPNFGHWKHGVSILLGRMPVTGQMPYQWYDTPNIHLCTLRDFEDLASKLALRITDRVVYAGEQPVKWWPSWRGSLALYRFERI